MERLKVFATEEETEEIANLALEAQNTPVIALTSDAALSGNDAASMAWKRVHETIYRYALAHDLPKIDGYYGFDPSTGEFLGG